MEFDGVGGSGEIKEVSESVFTIPRPHLADTEIKELSESKTEIDAYKNRAVADTEIVESKTDVPQEIDAPAIDKTSASTRKGVADRGHDQEPSIALKDIGTWIITLAAAYVLLVTNYYGLLTTTSQKELCKVPHRKVYLGVLGAFCVPLIAYLVCILDHIMWRTLRGRRRLLGAVIFGQVVAVALAAALIILLMIIGNDLCAKEDEDLQ